MSEGAQTKHSPDNPNDADLVRKGKRHASGADTPSGPNSDRSPRRRIEESPNQAPVGDDRRPEGSA